MNFFKYINSIKLLTVAMVCLLAISTTITSCEDSDKVDDVILQSFGPSGVLHGDKIKFIGVNLDKVTAIVLQPNIEVTQFEHKSGNLIEIIVPKQAEAGKVTLKTPQGDVESKTMLSFKVPVVINAITAEARPGETITITGDLLNWIESITFEDGVVVKDFVSQSLTELVVQVPMGAQTGFLIFSTGGTDPLTFASENELVVTLPAVTAISPQSIRHTEELTITGTDLDLITSLVFKEDLTVDAEAFISQSATEIVVNVPAMTLKGQITLKQASPVDIVTADELTIILPIGTNVTPSPAVPGQDNITISGTDLDLVKTLTLPEVAPIPAADFQSHTPTEIIVAVPVGTKSGGITYTTIHDYSSNLGVNVIVPGEGPPPLAITMYDDQVFYGGGDWSWGQAVSDPANTEQFYSKSLSWKHTTAGTDGGVSAGGMSGIDASGLGVFVFSLYGGPNTDGKQVAAVLGSDGADKWDSYNSVTLVEGKWTEYRLEMSAYPTVNFSNVTRWIFKVEGATDATLYVDRVGFDPAGPAPLDYYIYDDALQNGWANWNGWGWTTKDLANTEQVIKGSNSIKMVFDDQYGALQLGSPATDVFGVYTTLSFQVYAAEAQDMMVQIGNYNDTYLSIPQGWSLVDLPIANLDGNTDVVDLRFKNNNANLPTTLYFDEIGFKN